MPKAIDGDTKQILMVCIQTLFVSFPHDVFKNSNFVHKLC